MGARSLIRRWSLTAVLVATVAAAAWMPPGEDRHDEPAGRAGPEYGRVGSRAQAPPAPLTDAQEMVVGLDRLRARQTGRDFGDMFQSRTWMPPAPPMPRLPPQRPHAPALPFAYMGKMIENGKITIFLADGDRSIVVRKGETVDGRYRVDNIAADAVFITYLPLRERQILRIGSPD